MTVAQRVRANEKIRRDAAWTGIDPLAPASVGLKGAPRDSPYGFAEIPCTRFVNRDEKSRLLGRAER
jgi:hypothetical protein